MLVDAFILVNPPDLILSILYLRCKDPELRTAVDLVEMFFQFSI